MSAQDTKAGRRGTAFVSAVKRRRDLRHEHEREGNSSFWNSVGMMGTIGWSVSVPTALGLLLGRWLDARLDSGQVFLVFFMLVGLGVGCFTAWRMIAEKL